MEKLLTQSQISPFQVSTSSSVDGDEPLEEMPLTDELEINFTRTKSGEGDGQEDSSETTSNNSMDKSESFEKQKKRPTNINGREVSQLLDAIANRLQTLKRKVTKSKKMNTVSMS